MSVGALKLRVVCIHTLHLAVLHLLPYKVNCDVKTPTNLLHNIGQDVFFMWNTTNGNGILLAEWGLLASNGDISPAFIYIDIRTNVPQLRPDLNTAAVRYKGRVSWVGDLSAGHAWFKITNLTLQDTNQYGVAIREQGQSGTVKYPSKLTVAVTEGKDLVINCTAIGPPTPTVQWFTSDDTAMTGASKTGTVKLTKSNVQRSNRGAKYKCVASNNANSDPVSTMINVVVLYHPSTNVTPPTVTVEQDNTIILSCTADGNPPPSISWTKVNGVIKAGHTVAGGTLRITDAIKTDAGKYICTANNTYDSKEHSDTATATVVVKYQPSIMLGKLKDQTVNETDSFSIRCDADGYPSPTITWKTPTGSVYTGNVYIIQSVSRSHTGTCTCTASNGIGREAVASIQITVQFKPIIDESRSSSKTSSWNGNSIRLRCFATGLPAPQISWYNPTRQQITTGISIVQGGSEVTVLTTAAQGDYGQYKCRAINILGSDEHFINVNQLFSPGLVAISVNELEASTFNVRWSKPGADGGSSVTGYLMEVSTKLPMITMKTHAVITGLKADTLYTLKVYARNIVGYGAASTTIVTTKLIGKPSIPHLFAALLYQQESKLSVFLRWSSPDQNGGNITRYTIYMKEVKPEADWIKHNDVNNPQQVSYRIKDTIIQGKTYKFLVTAWNEYGESVREERNAKTVNTTAEIETAINAMEFCGVEGSIKSSSSSTVLGVVVALFILSLVFNLLLLLYMRRRVCLSRSKESQAQTRKTPMKTGAEESYENDFELEDNVSPAAPRAQQCVPAGPDYETINQPLKNASQFDEASNYQELNMLPITSIQGPVYEPLRTRPAESREQHSNNGQHPYEPLNVRNQNTTYQSLHSNANESAI